MSRMIDYSDISTESLVAELKRRGNKVTLEEMLEPITFKSFRMTVDEMEGAVYLTKEEFDKTLPYDGLYGTLTFTPNKD